MSVRRGPARRRQAKASFPRRSQRAWPLFGLSLLSLIPTVASAAPTGGQVAAGQATISGSGASVTVTQATPAAIINWSSFSLGKGESVHFQNGSGATLNRVSALGGASTIDGLLDATGSVYLINPSGVVIGKTGVVKVGGDFVASTQDLSDAAFLGGGSLSFSGSSNAKVVYVVASTSGANWVVNPASITVAALGGASTYGASPANPGLSATGLQNGQGLNVLTGLSNSFGISATTNAGSYGLMVSGILSNPNYVVTSTKGLAWTVSRAALTVSIIGDPTKAYDGSSAAELTSANFVVDGLVGAQSVSIAQSLGTYNSPDAGTATTVTARLSASDFVDGAGGFLATNYLMPTIATGAGQITPASTAIYPDPPDPPWPVLSFGNNLSRSLAAEFSLDDDLGPFTGPAFQALDPGPAPRLGAMIYPPNTAISPAIHFAPAPN